MSELNTELRQPRCNTVWRACSTYGSASQWPQRAKVYGLSKLQSAAHSCEWDGLDRGAGLCLCWATQCAAAYWGFLFRTSLSLAALPTRFLR